ncbi:MAG: HupE/UreJ family protein [Piscinibacter sp.]|uniref:HupE/UreJ family protein n=1 Tax=Piscinibacter sp. TaxID=1903157 RepID=UPI003D0FBE71
MKLRHLLALALGCLAGAAQAHKSSDAYLRWQVDGTRIEQRVDIALRDLDRELVLDADGDGQLRWGEVRSRWSEIERLADAAIAMRADERDCPVTSRGTPLLDEHTDGRYAVLRLQRDCAAAVGSLTVSYRLFAKSDADHRGIARLDAGGSTQQAVLVPGEATQRFSLGSKEHSPRSFAGFVAEGMHHIAIGLDHILFLATLLIVAVWRRDGRGWAPRETARSACAETLRLVTAFTAAHSITLGLAASGVLAPPSRWVESLIAASVLLAALDNLRPFLRAPRWMMVSLFGLVHGFGFAGPLQDLGLAQGQLMLPLLGFNLGVELGQLALVALLLPAAIALRRAPLYRRALVPGMSAAVALLALVWTLERSLGWALLPS